MSSKTNFFIQIDEYVSTILTPHYKPNLLHYGDKCKHLETKTIQRDHWHEVAKGKEKNKEGKEKCLLKSGNHLPKQLHNHNSHVKNEITLRA